MADSNSHPTPSPILLDEVMRLVGWVLAAIGVGGYLFWALDGGLVREGNWVGVDFRVYHGTAQALTRGENLYETGISPPYVYPPLLAILVVPLTALPPTAATILWKLLQVICLCVAGWLLVRLLPEAIRPLAAGILLLGLLTVPVREETQVGESNSLVLLLIAAAIWLIAKRNLEFGISKLEFRVPSGRPNFALFGLLTAGLLLALAVSIKVLPALLVAYFWWRGPRTVAAVATGGFIALQLLSLAVTPSTAQYWLVEFPGLFGQAFPFPDNQSVNAFLSRALLTPDPNLPPMQIVSGDTLRPAITWLANLLWLGAALGVLWASMQRSKAEGGRSTVRLILEVGLVLLTTHLVSGSTWLHHFVQLSVPVLGLLGAWWLAQARRAGLPNAGRDTLLVALAVGVSFALLLSRPSEWLFAVSELAPGNNLFALLASATGLWAVLVLWVAVALWLVAGRDQRLVVSSR